LYALRAFHDRASPAVVHRDISPRNLLVNGLGILKVIDFGLAKEDPRATIVLTVTNEWFGTPGCMAPEQVTAAADVDHRADLYALGRSFTAALQGRNPLHADPTILPEPWKTICTKLCAHDAADRYQSADEAIVDALEQFLSHNLAIEHFGFHVKEVALETASDAWAGTCFARFTGLPDIDRDELRVASHLHPTVFVSGACDANAMFDKLEASAAIAEYEAGQVLFSTVDWLGNLYRKICPALDAPRRLACFKRLVTNALRYHRYSLMGAVRAVYGLEPDASVRTQMEEFLDAEDVGLTIHGGGVIPGRTP
ncbi:MAG TPA: protein kinase, partial [Polyangiaceae bacterium]|nr:protein kinase [Polyangiaceae bacterium]